MNSMEITKEIELLDHQRNVTNEKLNSLITQFQAALPSAVDPWMRKEVQRRIEDHPDVVEKLGVEKLKVLKSKLNDLINSLPKIVAQETSDKSDWPHNRQLETSGYGQGKNEAFFNKSFRNVINHLGGLLNEFGLLTEPKGHVSSWESTGNGLFRYAINPRFDLKSIESIAIFNKEYSQHVELTKKMEILEKELAKAKARELWESA